MAGAKGITLAFETGQESANLLRKTLDDLKTHNLKINFDPANMLLYGAGDPLAALRLLKPWVRQRAPADPWRWARRHSSHGAWGWSSAECNADGET